MRAKLPIIIILIFLISIGCIAYSQYNRAEQAKEAIIQKANEAVQSRENNTSNSLFKKVPRFSLNVTVSNDRYDLNVDVLGADNISHFGNFAVEAKHAFEEEFSDQERGELTISLLDEKKGIMVGFSTSNNDENADEKYGVYCNYRVTPWEIVALDSVEDLCKIFPATSQYIAKGQLDPADVAIYDEVQAVLEEEYLLSEDEVFEEIAPQYGMTADELKTFMNEMIEKIFDM